MLHRHNWPLWRASVVAGVAGEGGQVLKWAEVHEEEDHPRSRLSRHERKEIQRQICLEKIKEEDREGVERHIQPHLAPDLVPVEVGLVVPKPVCLLLQDEGGWDVVAHLVG